METTAAEPTFTFAQVESILAQMFGVAPEKRHTFTSRLQQLQKLGLPRGTQVGRGSRAQYKYWQLAELMLYLDLLDCGLPPSVIKSSFGDMGFFSIGGTGESVERHPGTPEEGIKLILHFNALEHLRWPNPERAKAEVYDTVQKTRMDPIKAIEEVSHSPGIVINVSRRLNELKYYVGQQIPELRDQPAFLPHPPRVGHIA